MNWIFASILLCVISLMGFYQDACAQAICTMKKLPDTGQNRDYTPVFGEDSDYLIHSPAYSVTAGIVFDSITGLQWQHQDGGEMTWQQAVKYCDTLSLAGYTDWQMPDCHELFSILNHDKNNPALDTRYFVNTGAEYWWSSQKQWNDSTKVWCVNAGGGVGNHPAKETISAGGNKKFHIRAVRRPFKADTLWQRFAQIQNTLVFDSVTGLYWTLLSDSLEWEKALSAADTLSTGEYTDWRLPNIKELQSINDEKHSNPSFYPTFLKINNKINFWSSTTLPNQIQKAWYLDARFGITTYAAKNIKMNILCVRGNSIPLSIDAEINTQSYLFIKNGLLYCNDNSIPYLVKIFRYDGTEIDATHTLPCAITDKGLLFVQLYFQNGKSITQKILYTGCE
jgi:hypothetical protein